MRDNMQVLIDRYIGPYNSESWSVIKTWSEMIYSLAIVANKGPAWDIYYIKIWLKFVIFCPIALQKWS